MNRNLRHAYRASRESRRDDCRRPTETGTGWAGRGRRSGFTLLELLIAITMLAMIIVIISGAIRLGIRSVSTGEKKIESLERFRTSLRTIDAQFQSWVPLSYDENGARKYYFKGERQSVQFSTNRSIWSGRRGYVVVTYRVESDKNGKQTLYATEHVAGREGKNETRLFEGFDTISFEYFYQDVTEETGTWIGQWTDDTAVPEKVRLRLALGKRAYSLLIPLRVPISLEAT